MEINHKTFGKIKFNYDWTKDISLDIFNKRHVLEINIDADEDAEFEINQEKAYIFFNNHLDEIVKEANSAIISYYNREISNIVSSYTNNNEKKYFLDIIGNKDKIYSLLQPKQIMFPLTFDENIEEFGFLCECDWDKENGIGIKFVNGVLSEIGYLIYIILASNRISKEGEEFVSKITGYTLENEDDFVQGNKEEITNI